MKSRKTLAVFLASWFVFTFPVLTFAKGGGGGGGGSRSYSSGSGSSGGRSSSFGSSRSYSGGSSSSGSSRSYSGGSGSSSSSSGRSYSGGSSPSTLSRNYSSPSIPSSSPRKDYVAPSVPKPKTDFDSAAQQAQQKQDSKRVFDAAKAEKAPKQEYAPRSYQDQRVKDLKKELSYAKMENRNLRQQQTFGSYYGRSAPCCYNDSFNIWFWLWLMDRPHHERDAWVYHHRDQIDPARYAELKRDDKDLENRLKALEEKGIQKDPTHTPSGIDKDLMYSDEKVVAVYKEANTSKFPWGWLGLGLFLASLIYLVFFARLFKRRMV